MQAACIVEQHLVGANKSQGGWQALQVSPQGRGQGRIGSAALQIQVHPFLQLLGAKHGAAFGVSDQGCARQGQIQPRRKKHRGLGQGQGFRFQTQHERQGQAATR